MIDVSCAIILSENKVLATQRSQKMDLPLQWEFPGGKVESNETPEAALKREIKEELSLDILISSALSSVIHPYNDKTIRLIPFICSIKSGQLTLNEHKDYRWLNKNKLKSLNWAEADIPIVEELMNMDWRSVITI